MLEIVLNWSNLGYISSEFYKLVSVLYLCSSIRHVYLALVKLFNCRFSQSRKNRVQCENIWTGKSKKGVIAKMQCHKLVLISCLVNMIEIVSIRSNLGYISSEFYKIVSVVHLCSSIRHVFWALVKAFNCRFYKNRKNKAEYGNIWTGKPKS